MDPGAGTEDKPLQRRSVELNDSVGSERTSCFSLQLAQRVDSACRRLLPEQQAVRCGRIRPLRSEGPEEL